MKYVKYFLIGAVAGYLTLVVSGEAFSGQDKVTVCHKPGTPAQQSLTFAEPALAAHIDHGDNLGACQPLPQPEPEPDVPVNPTPDPTPPGEPEPPVKPEPPAPPQQPVEPPSPPSPTPEPPVTPVTPQPEPQPPVEPPSPPSPTPVTPQPEPDPQPSPQPDPAPEPTPKPAPEPKYDFCGNIILDAYSLSFEVTAYETDYKVKTRFLIDAPEVDMSMSTAVANISYLWYESMVLSDQELSFAADACVQQYTDFTGVAVRCRLIEATPILSGRF